MTPDPGFGWDWVLLYGRSSFRNKNENMCGKLQLIEKESIFSDWIERNSSSEKGSYMIQIDEDWLATILCALNDAVKYNDGLRHSQTVKDVEDIEEWLLQIFQCKEYLRDEVAKYPELKQKLDKYFEL